MSIDNYELIVGLHSVFEALKNPSREIFGLHATEESFKELRLEKSLFEKIKPLVKFHTTHQIQELAKSYYQKLDFEYRRVSSNLLLVCSKIEIFDWNFLKDELISGRAQKVLILDQITDVNNMGAILRTASFYGVDAVLFSSKGEFRISPAVYRISSGAIESLKLVKVSSLPKIIQQAQDMGVICWGMAEEGKEVLLDQSSDKNVPQLLVLGSEEDGISFATKRVLGRLFRLESQGEIKSLNVSVAAAIAMERLFTKKA